MLPDDLLDANGVEDPPPRWWALYTLPRREKELMRRLRTWGFHHYGPLVKQRTRSRQGRIRTSYIPLFTGYVFLRGSEADRYQAMTTNCVSRCLAVDDADRLVADLRQIRRLIRSETPLTPEARIQPGMKVRIRSGSLAGMEGMVVKRRGGDRLLVVVQFLQQGASILLEDFEVERIDG